MIFEELVLQNFGAYKGRHAINLAPVNLDRPIILIGALNGGGKTTLLDALQLVLYGKFASCSNRGSLAYSDYLLRTINHGADPSEGALLELQFKHSREGKDETYRIIRSWRSTGKGSKENVEVLRNGIFDPVITERWYEYVDEFIPAPISNLFFFDGEKIESLADRGRAAELLRVGIHALLGLDLVDQLSKDLSVVENRRKAELLTKDEQSTLEAIDEEIKTLTELRSEIYERLAEQNNRHDGLAKKEGQLRDEYRRAGGELYRKRDSIEAQRAAIQQRLRDVEEKLRELAAGDAPLLLVQKLLERARRQAQTEHSAERYYELKGVLAERDAGILAVLAAKKAGKSLIEAVKNYLDEDSMNRNRQLDVPRYLNVEPIAFGGLNSQSLGAVRDDIVKTVQLGDQVLEQLTEMDRKLAAIPDPAALEGINKILESTVHEKHVASATREAIKREYDAVCQQIMSKEEERLRHLERITNQVFVDKTTRRILQHSEKVRRTLELFRNAVTRRHVSKLEQLILESFQQLVRKVTLVSQLKIEPSTYELTLYNSAGQVISAERLSAGERQLLAISILWGLAKASGRPLPCIIDTPLGRLDGTHRKHLVENYFPFASHQVILLSTDEEISDEYHRSLKGAIGKEYMISYDERKGSSQISHGYFC